MNELQRFLHTLVRLLGMLGGGGGLGGDGGAGGSIGSMPPRDDDDTSIPGGSPWDDDGWPPTGYA